jgi:4-alpha-glucanotransferase
LRNAEHLQMEALRRMKSEKRGFLDRVKEISQAVATMPATMKQLAPVQLLTWLGLFCMWLWPVREPPAMRGNAHSARCCAAGERATAGEARRACCRRSRGSDGAASRRSWTRAGRMFEAGTTMTFLHHGRHAGLLVPLFSMPSTSSWGVGDIADIPVMAAWLRECGLDMLQLLPLNEMTMGQNSPYGAISAFALDPVYISVARVPEFRALGGVEHLVPRTRDRLRDAQAARSVQYQEVRRIKHEALNIAYRRFLEAEWRCGTQRARQFATFRHAQAWWLRDYALFRALHECFDGRAWTEWPAALRDRDPGVLQSARLELHERTLFFEYLQWIASEQWQEARRNLAGVGLFGDLPFMVSPDSADVWAHPTQFDLGAQVGVPPDAFSETGQQWGLPVYRWDVHEADDYRWLRKRARRCAELYDGCRIDHLVGLYRTYAIPRDGTPYFVPADPAQQIAQGERLMKIFCSSGCRIIVEDLGVVPDSVRQSLARVGVPGFKLLRWERDWDAPGQPFRDPPSYPAVSVAMTGTHDTEPMRMWWERAPAAERTAALQISGLDVSDASPGAPFSAALRDGFLRVLFHAGSDLLMLPIQDVFGWSDRINVPATVGADNWTFRLPWPVDRLSEIREACQAAARLRHWAEESGRTIGAGRSRAWRETAAW